MVSTRTHFIGEVVYLHVKSRNDLNGGKIECLSGSVETTVQTPQPKNELFLTAYN
jgi:hypothetical protein